ncbi:hypothetical protein JK359_03205 [Streptomyces actinomycinicus]|uniref:L-amino acid ligase C-terminal domain-containing protein n=1 Tax=Streptomyces actinomycinicus TaxID=1695166 RepID=A0A937EF49_9ACTN|nr:hypothetical protein [Streptomyces actinomycinicus]MBL1080989.1 hypothetical protein [Streptomyces actinomycinicus]
MAQPVLLLGAGRRGTCGEFPLARIAAVRPVVLVDPDPPAWARPYLSGHLAADPARETETAEAVARYAAGRPVDGVLTWSAEHLGCAARVAGLLGTPGLPYETAAACADPVALRTLLLRHRVAPSDPEDAAGPLVSAETVVLDDEVRIVALTRTTTGPAPARSALRHCVHAHDGLLHNRFLRQCVERTVRALGLAHTVAHLTLRLTDRGPRVTDVTPFLAGDLIPLLVQRATGVDLARAAVALATGRPPELTPTRQRAAAVQFAYPAATGRLTHLHLDPAAAQEPAAERMVLTRRAGDPVTAAPHGDVTDRLAHWVVTGEDIPECEEALRRMARHLSAAVTPTAGTYAA